MFLKQCMGWTLLTCLSSLLFVKHLRSNNKLLLTVLRTHLKLKGDQAFAVAGLKLWNSLPRALREVSSLNAFKVEVKNYFLSLAFESVG